MGKKRRKGGSNQYVRAKASDIKKTVAGGERR